MWHQRMLAVLELFNKFKEQFERIWKNPYTAWILLVIFSAWAFYWRSHIPTVGKAIAVLAVVAAVMATIKDIGGLLEFCWMLLLFGFLFLEMRAIDEDKKKTSEELTGHFKDISTEAAENMKKIIGDEDRNFQAVMETQQRQFSWTIAQLLKDEREQNKEFKTVLRKQEQLFDSQRQFAEFLNGKLIPASDPTPQNNCGPLTENSIAIFLGTTALVMDRLPSVGIAIHGEDVISVKRTESGYTVLTVVMRDSSNRIIARLNENGFVVNPNYSLYMFRPDKSTVIVEDQFGRQMLYARFLNEHAFRLKGTLVYKDVQFPLELPNFKNSCMRNFGKGINIQ
jgi:hypothetical protein